MTSRQNGLSLIELMVALLLSTFLILAVTQIFLDNRTHHSFQSSQVSNLENARFAELLLNGYLKRAGYRRTPDTLIETAFPRRAADASCAEFARGQVVTTAPQGFCIRYQPMTSGELDCTGSAAAVFDDSEVFTNPPLDKLVILAFRYAPPADATQLHQGTLQCRNIMIAGSEFIDLVSNVADFSVDFGYGPNDVMDKRITSYGTNGTGIIRAVRYSVLLASEPNRRIPGSNSPVLTRWLDEINNAARLTTNDRNRLYQITQSTQTLRNYMP